MDESRQMLEVFEVDENGYILENYLLDPYGINKLIDSGARVVQKGWHDKVLHSPVYDFELEDWVEGATEEEIMRPVPEPLSDSERIDILEQTILHLMIR